MTHGFCDAATYVQTEDTDAVIVRLAEMFGAEGMRPVERPSQRLDHMPALQSNLWAATVFPGAGGWTVILTVPWDLLFDRPEGAPRSRFFELCRRLGVPGVVAAARDLDPHWGNVVAEADGKGGERAFGWWYQSGDDKRYPRGTLGTHFYDHRVELSPGGDYGANLPTMEFKLLPHLNIVRDDSRNPDLHPFRGDSAFEVFFYYLGSQLGGLNGPFLNDRRGEVYQSMRRIAPLPVPDGTVLYFEWPAGDRPYPQPDPLEIEAERAYANPRVFYADGSPVRDGDAVLFDKGMFPGRISGFLVSGGPGHMAVSNYLVKSIELGRRVHDAATAAEDLQLVERDTRDFLKAGFAWLDERAARGDGKALFALGNLYVIGYGVPKDLDRGLRLWRRAADQGYGPARAQLDKLR